MIILGIETSCDETACAILKKDISGIHILSNIVSSSATLQAKYGGIIPEQAAREQIKAIIPIISEALNQAFPSVILRPKAEESSHAIKDPSLVAQDDRIKKIDAIAVTFSPGLIGSLLVGVETAKTLALIWNKPLIPVNHLLGHFYANWIQNGLSNIDYSISVKQKRNNKRLTINDIPAFPCLGLLVSGGHTDLVLFKDHGKYEYLGGTRDDAAGECFDKCARLLNLPYPGGPEISKLAKKGDPNHFKLPIPMRDSKDFDFSYSGLKTAVANLIQKSNIQHPTSKANLAASIEDVIVKSLIEKVIMAIQKYKVEHIMVAGGVAANQKLVSELKKTINNTRQTINLHIPPPNLCTDNGAMIACSAFFQKPIKNPLSLQADPNLSL